MGIRPLVPMSRVRARPVRFARALALLSTTALPLDGCGGPSPVVGPIDGGAEVAARSDASLSEVGETAADSAADAAGARCTEDEYELPCAAGSVCLVEQRYGTMRCEAPDGGVDKPCGAIACGWLCACADPAASVCFCYADGGPLRPPALPRRRRARRQNEMTTEARPRSGAAWPPSPNAGPATICARPRSRSSARVGPA